MLSAGAAVHTIRSASVTIPAPPNAAAKPNTSDVAGMLAATLRAAAATERMPIFSRLMHQASGTPMMVARLATVTPTRMDVAIARRVSGLAMTSRQLDR